MRIVNTALLLLFLTGLTFGQTYRELISKIHGITLLKSNQAEVQQILASYNTSGIDGHFQRFYNDEVDIRITFSEGTCSDDPDETDGSLIWKVGEWTVTRIEISPDNDLAVKDSGLDISNFTDEQMYSGMPQPRIRHDKDRGLAIETDEDGITNIIFFPSSSKAKKICEQNKAVKGFYARESWFGRPLKDRFVCSLQNLPPTVDDVILSETEVQATTGQQISVKTIARDPENDVLTYVYTVSAGKIIGSGANVVWDLFGVPAGSYSIIVAVDDGAPIVDRAKTKTVTIK